MKGKNILSLSLILTFITVMMMNIRTVQAAPYEYLYVDGFTGNWVGWNTGGSSPYLNAPDVVNYIEGTFDGAWMGWFTFDDINLLPCQVITKVVLEGYTNGPYNDMVDYDVYTQDFQWLGSLYATGTPAGEWVTPRWIYKDASEVAPDLLTQSGLNGLEVMLYFYDPNGFGGAGNIIDALRLKVYTAISATIDIDPDKINLNNNAQFLTCYIELCTGFSATDIDPSTVKLDGIPALASPWGIGDNIPPPNGNGIDDLMVKFDQNDVKNYIVNVLLNGNPPDPGQTVYVTLKVTGSLYNGDPFTGNCTIGVKG